MLPCTTSFLITSNALSSYLARCSPDTAILVATAGLCLIAFELNRPGRILPGSSGLVLLLLALAALSHHPLRPAALGMLGSSACVLVCNLWKKVPVVVLLLAGLVLAYGLRMLVKIPAATSVSLPVATVCGGILAVLASILSRIAFRARRLKAVH